MYNIKNKKLHYDNVNNKCVRNYKINSFTVSLTKKTAIFSFVQNFPSSV